VSAAKHGIALSRHVVFAALSGLSPGLLSAPKLFFCGFGVIRIPLRGPKRCLLSATTNDGKHNSDNQQEAVEYWLL